MKRHTTFIIALFLLALIFGTVGYVSGFVYRHRAEIKSVAGELASVVMTSVRVIIPQSATPTSTATSTVPAGPPKLIGELKTYTNKKYGISFSYPAAYAPFLETGWATTTGCAMRLLFHQKQYVDEAKNALKPEPAGTGGARFSLCLTTPTTTLDAAGQPYATIEAYAESRGGWLRSEASMLTRTTVGGFDAIRFQPTARNIIRFIVLRLKPDRFLEVYDGLSGYEKNFLDIFEESFEADS